MHNRWATATQDGMPDRVAGGQDVRMRDGEHDCARVDLDVAESGEPSPPDSATATRAGPDLFNHVITKLHSESSRDSAPRVVAQGLDRVREVRRADPLVAPRTRR